MVGSTRIGLGALYDRHELFSCRNRKKGRRTRIQQVDGEAVDGGSSHYAETIRVVAGVAWGDMGSDIRRVRGGGGGN